MGTSTSTTISNISTDGFISSSATYNTTIIIVESGSDDVGNILTPLIETVYDSDEISKAIDITISELIPFIPEVGPPTVLKSLYDERLNDIEILQSESIFLQNDIDEKLEIINDLLQISASLSALNTATNAGSTALQEQVIILTGDVNKLSADLSDALTEMIELKIDNAGSNATIAGLEAERNSLITQVTTLQLQIEGVQSIITAGGELSGELGVGIIPDEPFEGLSTYAPKGFANSYPKDGTTIIESNPKSYTFKNASTDFVTLIFSRHGNNPYIVDYGYLDGEKISLDTYKLQSGESMIFTIEASFTGTRFLRGDHAGKNHMYTCEIQIQVVSAAGNLTEDLQIDCLVNRKAR